MSEIISIVPKENSESDAETLLKLYVERFGGIWSCPECRADNEKIDVCVECGYLGLRIAAKYQTKEELNKENKKVKERFWSRLGAWFGAGIFATMLLGAPIGLATSAFWYDRYYPSPSPTPTTPTPSPTPSLTPIVEEALKQHIQANWNGWTYKGYDDKTTYLTDDEGSITAYIENAGRSLELSFDARLLSNGATKQWMVIPTGQKSGN